MEQAVLRTWEPIQQPFVGWEIDRSRVRQLSTLCPARSVLQIMLEWAALLCAIAIGHRSGNPVVYIVAVVMIGARQHALLLLMHEATHWRLFNTKWLNDWVCEPLITWPVLVSLRSFRHTHLAHHQNLNLSNDPDLLKKGQDPDWHFPLPRRQLFWSLSKQFTPLGLWYLLKVVGYANAGSEESGQTGTYRRTRVTYYISALALIIYFRVFTLFLAYWMVPVFTSLIAFNKMRVLSEHPPIERATAYRVICKYRLSLLERALFAPLHCYYHIEHHSYPSVPFFNLPRLHRDLTANRDFRQSLRPITYWGLLKSLCQ